MAMKVQRLH